MGQEAGEDCITMSFIILRFTRYYLCVQIKRMRWAGHVTRMGGMINAYIVLTGKPEGVRPLVSPRRR
jgi:hypothetical protein